MNRTDSVTALKGVGPKKAEALGRLGIRTVGDLASYYPHGYEDRRHPARIAELKGGERCLINAVVLMITFGQGFGKNRSLRLLAEDDSGRIEILFFHAAYLAKVFKNGNKYSFYGTVKANKDRLIMFQPDFSPFGDDQGRILPVYGLTKGISQKDLRKLTEAALTEIEEDRETLPADVIASAQLCSRHYALKNIHYPEDETKYRQARFRLVFEEFFYLKSALLMSENRFGAGRSGYSIDSGGAERFLRGLPYKLTGAQSRALGEILADMRKDRAMNRLLQGDVGSGKTAVAAAACAQAFDAGFQSAFMAPTELLAKQHYESLSKSLGALGAEVGLLTGSQTAAERRAVLAGLADGEIDVVVGTHAIISEGVEFSRLGLVITDEQHRFGVNQRKKIEEKGNNPDVLVMTATPIPRTLAVVLYGDLDVSVIDELPAGRLAIDTRRFNARTRKNAYGLLEKEVESGRQAYIVCPFIADSDDIEGHSAESLYAELVKKYPEISFGLLHGAMKQQDKDSVMQSFADGNISVLVSTVVIEVGIDVPNASVIIIENSERFGLAQLHQLRGRVGRGKHQSYCLLINGDEENEIAVERAETMCSTASGFEIAEKDLDMRGPGEFFGYRQHGLPQLVLADPVRHARLAKQAAEAAEELFEADPSLSKEENRYFGGLLREKFTDIDSITL